MMTATTKHHTCIITPSAAGFGQYQRGESEPTEHESAAEHVCAVLTDNPHVVECMVDGEGADGDLAAAINAARGAVLGGHGTLIAYRDRSGEIILESFED